MPETLETNQVLLIVDNSLLILERLITILKEVKTADNILTAIDYTEAVNILKEKQTGIVLLDIQLPGKNGIELLRFIVKNHPEIKVVMISNLVSDYYQRLCKKIGAVHFIDKSKYFDLIHGVVAAL